MEYGITDPLKSGRDSTVKALKKLPQLRMFLDEDRNGAVDDEPASCAEWEWGECKTGEHRGAIIMVKNRKYKLGETVNERLPIKIDWEDTEDIEHYRGQWAATLQIADPDQVRIYNDVKEGAAQVLGKGIEGNLFEIHRDDVFPVHLNGGQAVILWMEAVDYPQENDGSDACVTMQLKFTDLRAKGLARTTIIQEARLRIAPWIMASDLDATHKVFARLDEEGDNALAEAIKTWVGDSKFTGIEVKRGQPPKGFARDVAKCGYAVSPHSSQVVIQEKLDMGSPVVRLPANAAKDEPAGVTRQPADLEEGDQIGQDNGGNLLVSPPLPKYPYGRIVYGGRPYAADFYHAQLVQSPIRMDSTWLRVGHIDEMLSFVRCTDGNYRALLMSPRLAFIILRPLAGRQITGPSALIDWATSVNDEMIKAGEYNQEKLLDRLKSFPVPEDIPDPEIYGSDAIEPVGFEENPACPRAEVKFVSPVTDTFVVFRINPKAPPVATLQACLGVQYAELWRNYEDKLKTLDQDKFPFAQVRLQTRRFLQNFENKVLETLEIAQPPLDRARRKLEELGFKDKIIEVPVLLRNAEGKMVGLTADSVNMLVLAQGSSCRCLVPKPFGPTANGQYVYEEYIKSKLGKLVVDCRILADDPFHVQDGEIHCGTNQMPEPFADDLPQWWKTRPQPVEAPEPLPKREKLKGTLRVRLAEGKNIEITWAAKYQNKEVQLPVYAYRDEWKAEWPAEGVHNNHVILGSQVGQVGGTKQKSYVKISDIKLHGGKKGLRFAPEGSPDDELVATVQRIEPVAEPKVERAVVAEPSACNHEGCNCEGYKAHPFAASMPKFRDKCIECQHPKSEHPGAN